MSSSSHNPRKQKLHHGSPFPSTSHPNPFSLLCLPFPIFMIRTLPDGHLHPNPPNLPPSGKFPTSLPSLSRRFMGRHKRVSSGRHACATTIIASESRGTVGRIGTSGRRLGKKKRESKKSRNLLASLANLSLWIPPAPEPCSCLLYTILESDIRSASEPIC